MDTESTDSGPADEDLLRRLSSDPAAFELFYRRHVDRVIGFAARRVTDPADAADLVAATFVTVLTAARSYDPGRGEPGHRDSRADPSFPRWRSLSSHQTDSQRGSVEPNRLPAGKTGR